MTVTLRIDGRDVTVEAGTSILEAARSIEVDTPTLCYSETLTPAYACRVCVVETGPGALIPACARQVEDGMEVSTTSDRVVTARRTVFELLGSAVDLERTSDDTKAWATELDANPGRFGSPAAAAIRATPRPGHHDHEEPGGAASVAEPTKSEDPLYVRDYAACIMCFKCTDACGDQHQNTFAISPAGRGFDTRISTEFDVALPDSACVYCGNCIEVCPTGALVGKIEWDMRRAGTWNPAAQDEKRSICGYCGVGCNLDITTQEGRIVSVGSPRDHDVTLGNLCIKGRFGWQFVYADE